MVTLPSRDCLYLRENIAEIFEFGCIFIDMRLGNCFTKYNGFRCEVPLFVELTMAECCCGTETTGMRAWGSKCKSCPKKGRYTLQFSTHAFSLKISQV